MTINLRDCKVSPPLDCIIPKAWKEKVPTSQYGVPSALTARLLEYQVAIRIPEVLALHALGKYPRDQDQSTLERLHQFGTHFQKTLPATHRFEKPDTSWDTECPFLPAQRELLVCHTNAFLLGLHRPYILLSEVDQHRAVSAALAILDSQDRLFHQFDVRYYKLYSLSFFTFDAAVILSVVLISQPHKYTDIYARALQCLTDAVDRLQIIAEKITMAKTGGAVIQALLSRIKIVRCAANNIESSATGDCAGAVNSHIVSVADGHEGSDNTSFSLHHGIPPDRSFQMQDDDSLPHRYLHSNSNSRVDAPRIMNCWFRGSDIPVPTRDLATANLTALPLNTNGEQMDTTFGAGQCSRLDNQNFHFEGDFDFEGDFGNNSFWSLMNSGSMA